MRFSAKTIFLILTVLMAGLYVWPELNFQDLLAQGDHGRDLYAFDAVTRGKLPYKDFWWVYGPLMPYYYGLFFKIFGVHITSVLLGRALLVVLTSVFFYLAAECLMAPGLAFLAATWFTQSRQEFFFTYNHVSGIAAELAIVWCLLAYLRAGETRYLWIALMTAFTLGLIKINFGLAALAGLVLGVVLIDYVKQYPFDREKNKFYLGCVVLAPLVWGLVYWLFLHGLPLYAIRQCMPYFGDDQPYHASPMTVLPYYLMQHVLTLVRTRLGVPIGLVLHGCTLYSLYILLSGKLERRERRDIVLALGLIWLFFALYFHEFIVSGIWYRTYWSAPFLELFHFVTIALAFRFMPQFLRILILIFLGGLCIWGIVVHIGVIESQKNPYHYLSMDRGHIYVGNEPQWTDTVNRATAYLNGTLKADDVFLALPYDCLYYYLTGRDSPTRQLIFFNHIKVPPQQEIAVIRELQDHHTDYVLMSNRIISNDATLGVFGNTYCPLLGRYVHDDFVPLVRIGGDWTQPPGWANNHGVIVMRKRL